MKIIIAGAGLTGLSYALLLKRAGYDVEIYEKRPIDDMKNLNSIIYITEKTLDIIKPFIADDIFNKTHPKSFIEGMNNKLLIPDAHASINIKDLLQALLDAAAREGISIHRQHQLTSIPVSEAEKKEAIFLDPNGKHVTVSYDQLLIACGNRDIKTILEKNNYKKPVEMHYTNLIAARISLKNNTLEGTNKASIAIHLEFNYPMMILAQLASYYFNYSPISVGYFSLYMATQNLLGIVSTYPPERREELISSPENAARFMRDRLINLRIGLSKKAPAVDFNWLEEHEDKVNKDNVCPITAFASVHIPDKSLLQQGVMTIGDAFVTAPFIFGSEYNEHVQNAFPQILKYLNALNDVKNEIDKHALIDNFIETMWMFILDKNGIGKYLSLPDFVGNTLLPDGSRVNLSPSIGYPLSRELLENLSQHSTSWIPVPAHQQGGLGQLENPINVSKTDNIMSNTNDIPAHSVNDSIAKLGMFAAPYEIIVDTSVFNRAVRPSSQRFPLTK